MLCPSQKDLPSSFSLVKNRIYLSSHLKKKFTNLFWKLPEYGIPYSLWCHGVVVITTAQLQSTKPELRFCTGSSLARSMLEIHNGEDL